VSWILLKHLHDLRVVFIVRPYWQERRVESLFQHITITTNMSFQTNGRILKANLSWSWAKFCQLIARLFVVLFQLIWQNSNLSAWNLALSVKKKNINTGENFFASLKFDFFRIQLKFGFKSTVVTVKCYAAILSLLWFRLWQAGCFAIPVISLNNASIQNVNIPVHFEG